tara:strand:- start:428 stop:1237 length:810 start_codon:yes stop_codon:yes gene_type:complete
MATVNLGAIKFNWKGAYNNSTAYVVDDVVSSSGSSYVCILASQGNAVSNGTYWNIMSSAGTNGTNGTNGTDVGTVITTQGDILYRDGSGLARLGYGTSGQILQTGGSGANPSWTNAPVGIAMADQWRPASAQSGNDVVYNTWERIDTDTPGYIGSAMSHSSGIFTFPSTGRYWIQFRATMTCSTSSDYVGAVIEQTANDSSYSSCSIAYESVEAGSNYMTNVCSFLFHCAGTGTHKVRFKQGGSQQGTVNLIGGTASNESEVTFIRLGD